MAEYHLSRAISRFANPISLQVQSVAFSADGTLVVSGSEDGLVKIWDAATGGKVSRFEVRWRCDGGAPGVSML